MSEDCLRKKEASGFSHGQVGALSVGCQRKRSGRTGITFFSMSLHISDLTDYEIIAYRLQKNISGVVLLSL